MADAKSIINLGLGKIAASKISSITPPRSPLEKHCADGYPIWRDHELSKYDWVFAKAYSQLTLSGGLVTTPPDGRQYRYAMPNDCLRPIRTKQTEWEQRGSYIYSAYSTLVLEYIRKALEAEFVPPFIDVLASRVAIECVEYATQSNSKEETAQAKYTMSVNNAAKLNAFVIGPQDVRLDDNNSEWVDNRINPGLHD